MNYNDFFNRLLLEAATYPSASETDGMAQKAIAGDNGDIDAVNDTINYTNDAAEKIRSGRQEIVNQFQDELDSVLNMSSDDVDFDFDKKADAFKTMDKKIKSIEANAKPNNPQETSNEILGAYLASNTDFGMELDEAKQQIKQFLSDKEKFDDMKEKLKSKTKLPMDSLGEPTELVTPQV